MNVDEACELATRVSPCVEIEYYFAVYFCIASFEVLYHRTSS